MEGIIQAYYSKKQMTKSIYIKGYALISAQNTFGKNEFPETAYIHEGNSVMAIEPDYKPYVNPVAIRRMSRITKMGIAVAKDALLQANLDKPDAIIMGTGLGCMEDTEKFLQILIDDNEQNSAPTSFISSTHNTVAASIALQLKCLGYNYTYVHKALSLHSAMLDATVQIKLGNANHVLVGGIDEHTINKHRHYGLAGWWKENLKSNLDLFNHSETPGTLAGEGAAAFILSSEKDVNTHLKFRDTKSVFKPENIEMLEQELHLFLKNNNCNLQDIDLFISGYSADNRDVHIFSHLENIFGINTYITRYKHLSGTYYTSDNHALWMACIALEKQYIPDYIIERKGSTQTFKKALIFNSSQRSSNVFHLIEYVD